MKKTPLFIIIFAHMKRLTNKLIPALVLLATVTACTRQEDFTAVWLQSFKDSSHTAIIILIVAIVCKALSITYILCLKAKKQKEICRLKEIKAELEDLLNLKEKQMEEHRREITCLNNKNSRTQRTLKEEIDRLQKQLETLRTQLQEKNFDEAAKNTHFQTHIEAFKKKFSEYHKDYLPPTEKEWDDLEKAFISHHKDYYHFISSFLNMKKNHIYICMMIRLGITERMMSYALETDNKRIDRLKRQTNRILFGENNAKTLRENFSRHFP